MVLNTKIAKHLFASTASNTRTFNSVTKTATAMTNEIFFRVSLNRPTGVGTSSSPVSCV